jgi:hypothetical protein
VCAWAFELGIEPADVEMLMFTQAASSRSSQWSQPELLEDAQPPGPAVEAVDPDVHEVLAALDEAAEAFSELAGVTRRGRRRLRARTASPAPDRDCQAVRRMSERRSSS